MLNYDIQGDLADQRQDYLAYLLATTLIVGILPCAISLGQSNFATGAWLCLAITLVVSNVLRARDRLSQGSWVYLLGLTATSALLLEYYGVDSRLELLLIIPVVVSVLLLNTRSILFLALLCYGLMFGTTALNSNFGTALGLTLLPGLFTLVAAVILHINATNVLQMVYWATDIQRKDTKRAEMYFEQKEQLSQLLLQLTHAHSKLELMNVKLEIAQRKTEEASKAKSIFLSNMSHELRTPLNVIIGYTSTMLDMPGMYNNISMPPSYREDVKLIKDNGYYLLGLINDILDLSKIEAGKLELHRSVVNLSEMFRGILATSIGLVNDKPLQIRPDFPDDLALAWADPTRIRQIVLNLMSNAIKFTPSGSVTLQAHVEQNTIRISVIDTGIGIAEKAIAHIFDRFEQAEHDTDQQYGGTGLGLDISQQMVRMHGGELTVQSTIGQGSVFAFTLPIATAEQLAQEALQSTALQNTNQAVKAFAVTQDQYASTILLVEDESSIRDILRRTLEGADYVVVDVQDGAQALEMAVGLLPELIILDIRLPDMDGWQVLADLKHNPDTGAIPVLVCTANEDEERATELGADLYLRKPFSADQILTCVEGLVPRSIETDKGLL